MEVCQELSFKKIFSTFAERLQNNEIRAMRGRVMHSCACFDIEKQALG